MLIRTKYFQNNFQKKNILRSSHDLQTDKPKLVLDFLISDSVLTFKLFWSWSESFARPWPGTWLVLGPTSHDPWPYKNGSVILLEFSPFCVIRYKKEHKGLEKNSTNGKNTRIRINYLKRCITLSCWYLVQSWPIRFPFSHHHDS